jgi:hypothetical protein
MKWSYKGMGQKLFKTSIAISVGDKSDASLRPSFIAISAHKNSTTSEICTLIVII